MTQILIYHSKHGESMWDATTDEKLESSCRKIIAELLRSGWIPKPDDPMKHIEYSDIDLEQANLTDEQIASLPTAGMQLEAQKHKKRLARRMAEHEDSVARYDEYVKITKGEDVFSPDWVRSADSRDDKYKAGDVMPGKKMTAWTVLQSYEDEYVRFELESVIDPDGD